jgi:hypothetical protein
VYGGDGLDTSNSGFLQSTVGHRYPAGSLEAAGVLQQPLQNTIMYGYIAVEFAGIFAGLGVDTRGKSRASVLRDVW